MVSADSDSQTQHEFLQRSMTSDVVYNSTCGHESLTERIEEYCFISLVGTTTTSFIITIQTLRDVFPHHLIGNNRQFREILLHQRIMIWGSVHFVWGNFYC
ncbi:hypothetical protein PHMEG_00039614 [Phytophthora megakarya]|uniref:Uncharacterized protein n=1 Tax=Phytophthora megakarya TaxID=4795 RepID=A0A225UF85_9STRA|nr:hypothetical protein PHMEG_00039614 [Phytophthora megakarya]